MPPPVQTNNGKQTHSGDIRATVIMSSGRLLYQLWNIAGILFVKVTALGWI